MTLTKKQREAWKALYAPGDHLELEASDWKDLHQEAETEYEEKDKLISRIPFREEQLA
jgi:hypothetical protein